MKRIKRIWDALYIHEGSLIVVNSDRSKQWSDGLHGEMK
jgi:hypothetical protein